MIGKNLFSYSSYKAYIRQRAGGAHTKKGVKTALAKALHCQPTYISQVLHGKAHLSPEQAEAANHFFGHTREEAHFFHLLLQKERAGTKSLARYYDEQIQEILQRRLVLTSRLGAKQALSAEHQSIYYSSWIYAAVHIALTIPELRTRDALSRYLHVAPARITEVLEFLVAAGLAVGKGEEFVNGPSQVRLGRDSQHILRHHANWRAQAIEALEREELTDLHYSGVVSLSREDVVRVKDRILESIEEIQKTVRDSREEELCALTFDLFRLKR
jgi:uncharacterized protein (TIGR02147 family)